MAILPREKKRKILKSAEIMLDISEKLGIILMLSIEDLCNGSTPDSDSVCGGSNPSSSAKRLSRYSSEYRDFSVYWRKFIWREFEFYGVCKSFSLIFSLIG